MPGCGHVEWFQCARTKKDLAAPFVFLKACNKSELRSIFININIPEMAEVQVYAQKICYKKKQTMVESRLEKSAKSTKRYCSLVSQFTHLAYIWIFKIIQQLW